MTDFNIRSESVDVEQIMQQIRSRVSEKRGVDYTEEQIQQLASVRLEKFLDPKNLRSDLLEQFRRTRPALPVAPAEPLPVEAPYAFDDQLLFATHRGFLRFIRRVLQPVLKLFVNLNPLIYTLHKQADFNVDLLEREQRREHQRKTELSAFERSRGEWNVLYYEVLHNLVLETTRSGIEVKNLKMRVESLASRLDFSERRVRALEGVVQYRPEVVRPRPQRLESDASSSVTVANGTTAPSQSALPAHEVDGRGQENAGLATPAEARRKRRRRRNRRAPGMAGGMAGSADSSAMADTGDELDGDGSADEISEQNDPLQSPPQQTDPEER